MTSRNAAPSMRRRRPAIVAAVVSYAILLAGAALTLGPFLLSVATSLKTPKQLANESPLNLPNPFSSQNYVNLFNNDVIDFGRAVWVTAAYAGVVVLLQVGFSVMAGYAFARVRFPGREAVFWVYLATLMVPPAVTIVPLYLEMVQLGARNTFWGLVLPYLFGSPYAIFLLREYFRGIPQDLVDAARIDGAGHWRILTRIMVPLARPVIATLGLITVVTHWNNFLWPLIITSGPTWGVITVTTASMQSQYNGNWTLVMAATTTAMAPLILLFIVFNKQIVNSIAITGFR